MKHIFQPLVAMDSFNIVCKIVENVKNLFIHFHAAVFK